MGFLTSRGVRPVLLLIALVACLAPGAGEAAILKQVTASSIILPGNTVNNVALANVTNINKAFVACQTETTNTAPSTMIATCELTTDVSGNAQLTITTGATVTNNTILVQYYVAEFSAGVTVQRGVASFTGTNTTPGSAPSLTAVDCTKSFVLLTQRSTSTSTTADETWLVRGILGTGASPCTSSTTTSLELTRLDAVNGVTVSVAWQVVTMEGASVQRGTSCIGGNTNCTTNAGGTSGTSNRITLGTAVDTTKSFILANWRGGTSIGGVEGEYNVRTEFLSTGASVTGVQFVRARNSTTGNHQVDIAYEVISLSDGSTVQTSGTSPTAMAVNTGSVNVTLTTVDTTRTAVFYSTSGGDNNATRTPDTTVVIALTGSNGGAASSRLTLNRATNTNLATSTAWFAVSFFRCSTSSGTSYDTLCTVGASTTGTTATVNWSSVNTVLVARSTSTISAAPTNGTPYTAGNTLAAGVTVIYSGSTASDTSFADTGRTTNQPYFYKVWAKAGATGACTASPCYVAGVEVSVTPRSGSTAWSSLVAAGGATLNPAVAGTGRVSLPSNNGKLITVDSATGIWDSVPAATTGAVQGYLSVFGTTEMVVGGDSSGWVYSVDPNTGAYNWLVKLGSTTSTVDAIQAAVSVYSRAFFSSQMTSTYPGSYDIIFVATNNTLLTNNKVIALRSDTGGTLWTFDPATLNVAPCVGGCPMDQIVGQPFVDYFNDRLYISSGPGSGGSQKSQWSLNLRTNPPTLLSVIANGADFTTAPSQSFDGTKLYTGDAAGLLHIVTVSGFSDTTNSAASGTAFKGFVWEDFEVATGKIYFVTTDGNVWCLVPPSTTPCWKTKPVASGTVSQMLISFDYAWVGGSNGTLYQLSLATGSIVKTFAVGAGTLTLGPISTETGDELYVTTSDQTLYKISLTNGSLP